MALVLAAALGVASEVLLGMVSDVLSAMAWEMELGKA